MSELGNIKIADDVVKAIAAKATIEVEGIYKMTSGVTDEVNKILGINKMTRGVKVEVGEKECSVDVHIVVEYGYPIPVVATGVQENVIRAITELTGLKVVEVNVYIQDVKVREVKREEVVVD
jgi:uncharacterized alkaline shock family protein YloU